MIRNRAMTRDELDLVLGWAAEEGWNPGLDDADAFWAADPEGFFVAEDGGAPVAAISVVNHSDAFAFLGLYICRPSHRGRGIGLGLWTHALAHAGTRTVGLDGVPAQQANYAASGFVSAGATRRFQGQVAPAASPDVRAMGPADVPALVALEAAASGWAKPKYMEGWFAGAETRRTFVIGSPGALVAAATMRRCNEGTKIGPLIAPDADTAWTLVAHVATQTAGPVTVDIPDRCRDLTARCQAAGLTASFETARMYRGAVPPLMDTAGTLYGVGSLELG